MLHAFAAWPLLQAARRLAYLLAQPTQRFALRLRQAKRQDRHPADLIEDQLINPFVAAGGGIAFGQRQG
jgi:hypothetical protein